MNRHSGGRLSRDHAADDVVDVFDQVKRNDDQPNEIEGNVMIYELRTYTVKPGTVGDMVKAASTVSRDIRGDNYGKLEGYWLTEIGPLNQVMHMWSYSDFNERRGCAANSPRTRAGPASTFR